jgi:hypothetical protein
VPPGRFVGREHELAVIEELRSAAVHGRGRQLAVLTGEAGIGKTWLADASARAAAADGWVVTTGRCWPHGGAPPLWPWTAMLADLLGPAGSVIGSGLDRAGTDPERFAVFRAVAAAVAELERPVLVVLDDAHRAERAALLLLRFLATALEHRPLVLVVTRRPERPVDGRTADLLDELERDSTLLPLRPFGPREATALLVSYAGSAGPEPGRVATLLRATGGSPMFLARAAAFGVSEPDGRDLRQAVVDALNRLSPQSRATLAVAAVLGTGCSVGEVAAVRGQAATGVLCDLAEANGLVGVRAHEVVFDHDLIREAALGHLEPAALLDLHAAAAQLLAPIGPANRVARHALAAASRSTADSELAVDACRHAAAAARRGFDYEAAADLLGSAAALTARSPDSRTHAVVLIERAEAMLASGRLAEARPAFGSAADAAETACDPLLVARAVLGMGGVWVHEYRNTGERERVLARQRAALRALPDSAVGLRARLRLRLSAEAVYEGGPVEPVLDALAEARAVDDDRVLAEALSLTHHALLGPEHLHRRIGLANELVTTASAAGDGVLALFGLIWRTVDLYELGDPAAERALADVRERAQALGVATVGYIVSCMDVMRLIRNGRLEEAEAAAEVCRQRGIEVGDADALANHAAQLCTIRWLQDRDTELAGLVTKALDSTTLATPEYAFRILFSGVLARAGRLDEARAALADTLAGGVKAVPRSSTWTTAMTMTVDAAALLGDAALAGSAARQLEPFADRPVMPSLGITCLGAAARPLGLAALVGGDLDRAVAWLERAVAANDRIRHRPAAALSRADLADALDRRHRPGDRERAARLFATAAADAAALDMPRFARRWATRTQDLTAADPPVLSRRRGGWTLHARGACHDLPDLVGMAHLAVLIAAAGRDIDVTALCGAVQAADQPVVDMRALQEYRRRLQELGAELAEAEDGADLARAEALRDERDALLAEVDAAVGLGGRIRGLGAPPERARTAVRKAISRALTAISACDPVVGEELRASVTTGATCRYQPAKGTTTWRSRTSGPAAGLSTAAR